MALIQTGAVAPDFTLPDQFGRPFTLSGYRSKRAVLINFYPRDFTPICSGEVPELNALYSEFLEQANTVPVAVSADSWQSHAAWCVDLGGVCMPVLSDAHPHGAVSRAYGAWIAGESITDRASVLVDRDGRVRWTVYAGKEGTRDVTAILRETSRLIGPGAPPGRSGFPVPPQTALYLDTRCPKCRAVLRAAHNAQARIVLRYVDRDGQALAELRALPQGLVVPKLRLGLEGPVVVGAEPIIATLANLYCPVP